MLRALYDYAVENDLALPPGYVNKSIKAYIVLSAKGEFLGIEQPENEVLPCPDIGSTANSKDKCNALVEKASVVLSEKQDAKSLFFRQTLRDGAHAEPKLALCLQVLEDADVFSSILAEAQSKKLKGPDRVSFSVGGEPVVKSQAVGDWWQTYRRQFVKSSGEARSLCLITGEPTIPMATVPPVSGLAVVGGHPRGDALICFDKSSFCSYGQKQAANAPVSEEAFAGVKAALDALIADAPVLAGMKFVHWYDKPVPPEEDCLISFNLGADANAEDEPDEETPLQHRQMIAAAEKSADDLIRSVESGQHSAPLQNRYHILLLTGVSGRVMIRRYEQGRYETLQKNISQWEQDLKLCDMSGTGTIKPYKLIARLLRLLSRQKSDKNPFERAKKELSGLTSAVLLAIIGGTPLPDAVAFRALAYIRSEMFDADEDQNSPPIPDGISCQWLKVWLLRKKREENKEETLMAFYNPKHTEAAYHCGAIMAVYAAVQKAAMPEVNAGVIQRYYAAASQTPALVIGRLNTLSNYHFDKITWPWLANLYNDKLSTVYCSLGDEVPVMLNLEQQAYFALGYRQMTAELNREMNEKRAELKEAKAQKTAKADHKDAEEVRA